MAKTLLVQSSETRYDLGSGATRYFPAITGGLYAGTAQVNTQKTWRTAGVASNLGIQIAVNSRTTNSSITLMINGSASALTKSITALTTGWFEDNVNTASIAAGDEVNIGVVGGTGGSALGWKLMSWVFEATSNTVQVLGHSSGVTLSSASSTNYQQFSGKPSSYGSTESITQIAVPVAGTLKNLCLYISANARTTDTVLRSRINGGFGNMTITVAGGTTGVFVEDTSNTDTIAAGNLINYSATTGTGSEAMVIQVGAVEFENTAGKSFISGGRGAGVTIHATDTCYIGLAGEDVASPVSGATEANVATEAQFTGTLSGLWAHISAFSGAGTGTITLRKNYADTALVLSFTGTGTFTDTTHSVDVVATDMLDYKFVAPSGLTSYAVSHWSVAFPGTAAGGPTSHALAGQADSTTTTLGALILSILLAGSAATASISSGQFGVGQPIEGSAASITTTTGNATAGFALNGSAGSISTTSGELTHITAAILLAGQSDTISTTSSTATSGLSLAGQSDSVSTATGTLSVAGIAVSHSLAGQSDSVTTTTANLSIGASYAGTAGSSSGSSSAIGIGLPLTGTADTTSTSNSSGLVGGVSLSGASDTVSTAGTAELRASYALNGTADTVSTATATLSGGTETVPMNFVAMIKTPRRALEGLYEKTPRKGLGVLYAAKEALSAMLKSL